MQSEGGFDIELMYFVKPHVQFGFDYQWDRWMAPSLPTRDDIWINRVELRVQTDVLALPTHWKVRPALHPRLGLGVSTGKWDQSSGTGRDRERFIGGGITPGADVALYFRLGDKAIMAVRVGISYPLYAMRGGGDRTPWDKAIGRTLNVLAGLSFGGVP